MLYLTNAWLYQRIRERPGPAYGQCKKHKLSDILFIAIAAWVADADAWNRIEDYAIAHEEFFRKHLELPAGIPSHDTFNRGFAIMDPAVQEEIYQKWVKRFGQVSGDSVISIDGKTIRGAGNKDGGSYDHIVSACLSDEGVSPGRLSVDSKTNEITGTPSNLSRS